MPDMGIGEAIALGGIFGGTQLASSALQSHAVSNATQAEQTANQNALDFEKQRYAFAQQAYAPYMQMGQGAIGNLSSLAGNVPYAKYGMSLSGLSQFGNGSQPMNMVQMRAPTGQIAYVPPQHVQHYQSRGAQLV